MTALPTCHPSADVVFTDLDGAEAVLVDLNTKQYFTLNETARLVWRAAADGGDVEAIVEEMTRAFEVSDEHARRSTITALDEFVRLGLMRRR
jgi:hypothetical protein